MIRTVLGSLLALAGAAAAALSPFRAWYAGRLGTGYRVDDLFRHVGVTTRDAALLGSLFLPMGFAALLTLLGVLRRSRLVVALAGVLVLGVTVLWMVRQAQFSHVLAVGDGGLGRGVADALLGAMLLVAGSALVAEPRRRPADAPSAEEASAHRPPADGGTAHGATAGDVSADGVPLPDAVLDSLPDTVPLPDGPPPDPPELPEVPAPDGAFVPDAAGDALDDEGAAPTLMELPGPPEPPEPPALPPRLPRLPELRPLPGRCEPDDGASGVPARQPLPENSPPGM